MISTQAARIKELTSINQSLSALANVVGALIAGKAHVPYRASKLTRLLQDSLGGTCKAAFVATMSPCASAVEETLSTLHFARRAMKVRVFAAPNVEAADTGGGGGGGARELRNALAVARSEIARLEKVVRQQRRGVAAPDAPSDAPATARARDLAERRAALAKEWAARGASAASARDRRDWLERYPVWKSNIQTDFNVSVIERFGPASSAELREFDESNRFVQKSAKSTSI